ncbi:MAG: cyclic nucleotide-binding domain-containing protein [candidate division Zixibacteria bacterium]|nr:cyclic nucleotide-binding domain-containing protein [candidate division Zixibacteria bacterium]
METLKRILEKHPFLAGLEPGYIELLVGCASNMVFKPEQFLFREGEEANSFFFIRGGKVSVETFIPEKGPIASRTLGEGEILGWSWLVPPYHWHFDARAIELTRVIALDGKCLREKLEQDHDLGYEIMKRFALIIAERLEATRLQLLDIYGVDKKKS